MKVYWAPTSCGRCEVGPSAVSAGAASEVSWAPVDVEPTNAQTANKPRIREWADSREDNEVRIGMCMALAELDSSRYKAQMKLLFLSIYYTPLSYIGMTKLLAKQECF